MKWDHIGISSLTPNNEHFKRLYASNFANRGAITHASYVKATGAADQAMNEDLPRG